MVISERDDQVIEIYARELGKAWPPISAARQERLAVLFSGPGLDDQPEQDRRQRRLPAAS